KLTGFGRTIRHKLEVLLSQPPEADERETHQSDAWIHELDEEPPRKFCHDNQPCGPVVGTREQLGYAVRHAPKKMASSPALRVSLQKAATGLDPRVWLRKTFTRALEAFFRSPDASRLASADVKKYAEERQKKPGESQ